MLLVLIVCSLCMPMAAKRGYEYHAMYGTAVIDGEIEEIWKEAQDAYLKWNWANSPSTAKPFSRCHVYMMHDDTYLYVLAVIHDYSPTISDSLEIYIDEEYTQLGRDQVNEKYGSGNFPDYTYQLGIPVAGMEAFDITYGPKGAKCKNDDGSIKSLVEDIKCKTIPDQKDSLGTYSIYQLEIKLHPVKAIPATGNWGVEFMYNDINGSTGKFINALRWNCDTVSNDGNSTYDDYPYQATISYAPLSFAASGVDVTPDTPLYPVVRETDKPLETYHETESESDTERPAQTETETVAGQETESETDKQTESEKPAETEKPTETESEKASSETKDSSKTERDTAETENGQKTTDTSSGGCGSVVAGGGFLVLSASVALAWLLKKERDK